MQIVVGMLMLAGMAYGGMVVAHKYFDVNTCPWYPPDDCP